jgi:D-alanyl-D-alanine carboxypeptidase (penicillin-binding protein 5/6)
MYRILATVALLAVSLLPTSPQKASLEDSLKEVLLNQKVIENKEVEEVDIEAVEKTNDFEEMALGSSAALFIDRNSGEILYEKSAEKALPMASITKLMTAIIATEKIEDNEILTVPKLNTKPLDSRMWLTEGDKLKFSEILHGLLVNSGSDAALTISNHISGSEADFAALMNEKAKLLGLHDTQFTNSVGWDATNHRSTARDLVNLTNVALTNKQIKNVVKKRSYTAESENGKKYILSNTNLLLNNNTYLGAKTGTTFAAGECLATYYNDGDREIIGVVLNSPSRFGETQNTINWIKENYTFYGTE